MTISLHEASVGVFVPFLRNLSALLDHAIAYAAAREIDPAVLLDMRLHPGMYNFRQQVAEAVRHANIGCALLAGCAPPAFVDEKPDVAELASRIATAITFIETLPHKAINAAADKHVTFTFKNGAQRQFTGRELLLTFTLPQFFFHVTTAYDILRHAGLDLTKKDFLGPPRAP